MKIEEEEILANINSVLRFLFQIRKSGTFFLSDLYTNWFSKLVLKNLSPDQNRLHRRPMSPPPYWMPGLPPVTPTRVIFFLHVLNYEKIIMKKFGSIDRLIKGVGGVGWHQRLILNYSPCCLILRWMNSIDPGWKMRSGWSVAGIQNDNWLTLIGAVAQLSYASILVNLSRSISPPSVFAICKPSESMNPNLTTTHVFKLTFNCLHPIV